MDIVVIGGGYVGLTSAVQMARLHPGAIVRVLERDRERIRMINEHRAPFHEPGLDLELKDRKITATWDDVCLVTADAVLICVGTPSGSDGALDCAGVLESVQRAIVTQAPSDPLIVIRSTCMPGTNDRAFNQFGPAAIVTVPEFLREGTAMADSAWPDRLVIGARSQEDADRAVALFQVRESGISSIVCSPASAELIKLGSNAMLAARISMVNELAQICEDIPGASIGAVSQGIGMDSRIGPHFLQAGLGWGGSCFPKDSRALGSLGSAMALRAGDSNRKAIHRWARRVIDEPGPVAVLGMSFKGGTDDVRDSPALELIQLLASCGFSFSDTRRRRAVQVFDPLIPVAYVPVFGEMIPPKICNSAREAAEGCRTLVVATDHREFKMLDLAELAQVMRPNPILYDLRNLWTADAAMKAGFHEYHSVGRSSVTPTKAAEALRA